MPHPTFTPTVFDNHCLQWPRLASQLVNCDADSEKVLRNYKLEAHDALAKNKVSYGCYSRREKDSDTDLSFVEEKELPAFMIFIFSLSSMSWNVSPFGFHGRSYTGEKRRPRYSIRTICREQTQRNGEWGRRVGSLD